MMTDIDYKKMILTHELSKVKGIVGAEMINNLEMTGSEYTDYGRVLNEVMENTKLSIDLLKYKGEEE